MSLIRKAGIMAILVAASTSAEPVSGQAMQSFGNEDKVDIERAEQLEAEAMEALRRTSGVRKAASLFRKAAELRPEGDPIAIFDLGRAGQLSFYSNDLKTARRTLLDAAEAAIQTGDVVAGANALIDVVHIAAELRDPQTAFESYERARLLTGSPLLSSNQRDQLNYRLRPVTALAAAADADSRRGSDLR